MGYIRARHEHQDGFPGTLPSLGASAPVQKNVPAHAQGASMPKLLGDSFE
jgi:hypothetical protein